MDVRQLDMSKRLILLNSNFIAYWFFSQVVHHWQNYVQIDFLGLDAHLTYQLRLEE